MVRRSSRKKTDPVDDDIDWEQMKDEVRKEQKRQKEKKKYPWSPVTDHKVFKKISRAVFRFCMYGAIMMLTEIAFYNMTRIGRKIPIIEIFFRFKWLVDVGPVDINVMWYVPIRSLYGQSSLWMFFVFGAIVFFGVERVYKVFHKKKVPWFIRGFIYMVVILVGECSTGWILFWLTGYKIWYYAGPLNILTYTSLAIAPIWFITGLVAENFFHIIFKLSKLKDITKL